MKKILFLDRDGTIIREPSSDFQVDALDKFSFIPGAISNLAKITSELDYELVLVTNQDGLGTDTFPELSFWPYQELMLQILRDEGVVFRSIHIDRSYGHSPSSYRKPSTAMLKEYINSNFDLSQSFVIGDRWTDIELAQNLGAKGIFISEQNIHSADCPESLVSSLDLITNQWKSIYLHLKKRERKASLIRNTNETKIKIEINLDGDGLSEINTGIPFFDHMLDQISKHGKIDLFVDTQGDLEIDTHHTIEDTALALGTIVKEALGKKIGIQRYGFTLPMDDCRAEVLIDFGGRSWFIWDLEFKGEQVGDIPVEMFYHFFKSFSDSAGCNLQIKATGDNNHHKIESIYKAFAKSIKMAVQRNVTSDELPSTKGVL